MIFAPPRLNADLQFLRRLCASLVAVLALVLIGCSDKQNSKIDDLAAQGYAFSVADFHRAAALGDVASLEAFLEAGMSVDAPDPNGGTALLGAALAGEANAVTFLIDHGADGASLAGSDGRNLLMMTAEIGADDVVQVLLAANSSPNTSLHISTVSSARSRAVTLPMIGLSEYLKAL